MHVTLKPLAGTISASNGSFHVLQASDCQLHCCTSSGLAPHPFLSNRLYKSGLAVSLHGSPAHMGLLAMAEYCSATLNSIDESVST